jgi:hypothetical protein
LRGKRAHIDDASPTSLLQVRQDRLASDDSASQVHLIEPVPGQHAAVFQRLPRKAARDVDQCIDSTELLRCVRECRCRAAAIREISAR